MRIIHQLSLLLIFSLACLFMEPAWVAGQEWYGYGYNSPYYPPSQADIEQHMWNIEAYNFLNYDDEGYYPNGVPAYNAPTYSSPANDTPAYNQSVDKGDATYWLNEANVSS